MATGSGDGHNKYDKILIDAPSMNHLLEAQLKIKDIYGKDFFDNYANDYLDSTLSDAVWKALIEHNYSVTDFIQLDDINDWTGCTSVEEIYNIDSKADFSITLIIDTFIFLLNEYGANIIVLDKKGDIPMICNWTCPGFEDVGYGCYK